MASATEHAKRRGISRGSIRQAIKSGRIPADGTPEEVDALLDATAAPPRGQRSIAGTTSPGETYFEARARREKALASVAEIELEERRGRLLDADRVRAAVFNAAARTRDKLAGIPDRVALLVLGLTDEFEVRRIIGAEINVVLEELSKPIDFPRPESSALSRPKPKPRKTK